MPLHVLRLLSWLGGKLNVVLIPVICTPGLIVHFRANVPGATVGMVHIPEYGTIGPWRKQEMHLGTREIYVLTFSVHSMFGKTYMHLVSDFQLHGST